MKTKIINLFEDKNTKPNLEVKYSELLEQFIEPFSKDFPDADFHELDFFEDFIDLAITAWNFANMKMILPDEENYSAINDLEGQGVDVQLLKRMIDFKIKNFKEYTDFIVDFEVEETDGDPILTVVSREQQAYLTAMLDDMNGQMSEADFEENYINRSSIILKPLPPFLDWLSNLFPGEFDDMDDTNTYLLSEEIENVEAWLTKNFDKLFMLELDAWDSNKKEWPQRRTYKMFKQWFQVDFSRMVYDLEKEPVYKS